MMVTMAVLVMVCSIDASTMTSISAAVTARRSSPLAANGNVSVTTFPLMDEDNGRPPAAPGKAIRP